MNKKQAATIVERINNGEVTLPGIARAAVASEWQEPAPPWKRIYTVRLIATGEAGVMRAAATVKTVEEYTAFANSR